MAHTKCSLKVNGYGRFGAFHTHQCSKNGVVERNGRWYCKIHDPEYIKKKQDKETQKFKEEQKKRRIELYAPELLEVCKMALEKEKVISKDKKLKII